MMNPRGEGMKENVVNHCDSMAPPRGTQEPGEAAHQLMSLTKKPANVFVKPH
jgi:hypothetical protein